jgi:hypothetical protein
VPTADAAISKTADDERLAAAAAASAGAADGAANVHANNASRAGVGVDQAGRTGASKAGGGLERGAGAGHSHAQLLNKYGFQTESSGTLKVAGRCCCLLYVVGWLYFSVDDVLLQKWWTRCWSSLEKVWMTCCSKVVDTMLVLAGKSEWLYTANSIGGLTTFYCIYGFSPGFISFCG